MFILEMNANFRLNDEVEINALLPFRYTNFWYFFAPEEAHVGGDSSSVPSPSMNRIRREEVPTRCAKRLALSSPCHAVYSSAMQAHGRTVVVLDGPELCPSLSNDKGCSTISSQQHSSSSATKRSCAVSPILGRGPCMRPKSTINSTRRMRASTRVRV